MIYKILIFLLLISFSSVWSTESLNVILEAQKVKEEWNFVNYRFYLTNVSNKPIQNPVITYYAKRDSSLSYGLDYVSYPHKVKAKIESYGDFSKLVFSSNGELSPRSMIELHFRIYKNNWSQLVLKEDWSYQKKDGVREPNYFVTVYDEHDRSLGIYTGKMLAGKTISVNGSKLKVELVSDNDGVQGWGVKIDKVRNIPFSIPSSLLNQN